MAMQIGAQTFLNLKGPPIAACAEALEEIVRPGVDGQGHRKLGKRSDPVVWESLSDFTAASGAGGAGEAIVTYRALQGTLVTTIDSRGVTVNNVAVENVRILSLQKVATPVGGTSASHVWWLRCAWTLRATA